ncbi:hypothetical protein Q2941_37485 [Bradyrhizobium sp. UFLA05-153]
MIPTSPALSGTLFVTSQAASVTSTLVTTCEGSAPRGGMAPMKTRVSGSKQV